MEMQREHSGEKVSLSSREHLVLFSFCLVGCESEVKLASQYRRDRCGTCGGIQERNV